ncbi:DUF1579 domain-containing protein [Chiayiivirga flava]|uniref:DUF1579 domain-containing protein n=1 Tax=Chiayiivirga flava TaxID=659595 RepID=A0A7W8D5I7_9GAMM|nr:DUF1579 domain-containing protein [Chiayiivirga flava]MBB5208309.1 hypothetical protein [Chiayiivirga flava]
MFTQRPMHALALAALLVSPAFAQSGEAPQMTPQQQAEMEAYIKAGTPGPQHAALAKMAGDYTLEVRSWHAPGAEPTVEAGTATRRMLLGDRVMVEDVSSQMMGQPFTGHGLHGYDNTSGSYWSTWNDNMSTGLMVSKGSCDAAMTCSYTGSWIDPLTKKEVSSRMTTRWSSPTVEVFEMYGPGPDGKETKMMEITYTKK